jgi:hypothetical protein
MHSKDILLNGMFRSANTYLAFAFLEAVENNISDEFDFNTKWNLQNHTHSSALLKLKDTDN